MLLLERMPPARPPFLLERQFPGRTSLSREKKSPALQVQQALPPKHFPPKGFLPIDLPMTPRGLLPGFQPRLQTRHPAPRRLGAARRVPGFPERPPARSPEPRKRIPEHSPRRLPRRQVRSVSQPTPVRIQLRFALELLSPPSSRPERPSQLLLIRKPPLRSPQPLWAMPRTMHRPMRGAIR